MLTVQNGQATARIVFSSPNYDYMRVGEQTYLPVNTEGNSAFEIPVTVFDGEMQVIADTVAMSTPHEITYTLFFDSSSILGESGAVDETKGSAAGYWVGAIIGIVGIAGMGGIFYGIKHRKKIGREQEE